MHPGDVPSAWVRSAAAGGQRTAPYRAPVKIVRVFTPSSVHSHLKKRSQQVVRGGSEPPNMFSDGLA
eukprot:4134752-Prymnesium_polylepis.1